MFDLDENQKRRLFGFVMGMQVEQTRKRKEAEELRQSFEQHRGSDVLSPERGISKAAGRMFAHQKHLKEEGIELEEAQPDPRPRRSGDDGGGGTLPDGSEAVRAILLKQCVEERQGPRPALRGRDRRDFQDNARAVSCRALRRAFCALWLWTARQTSVARASDAPPVHQRDAGLPLFLARAPTTLLATTLLAPSLTSLSAVGGVPPSLAVCPAIVPRPW